MSENFFWKAIYSDGTFLPQFNEDSSENKYSDIDREKICFFEVYSKSVLIFRLELEKGRRLIFRKRVTQCISSGKVTRIVLLVGWQQTINGTNVQDIAYVFEDGHVELLGKWKENRLEYAPVLIEQELKE